MGHEMARLRYEKVGAELRLQADPFSWSALATAAASGALGGLLGYMDQRVPDLSDAMSNQFDRLWFVLGQLDRLIYSMSLLAVDTALKERDLKLAAEELVAATHAVDRYGLVQDATARSRALESALRRTEDAEILLRQVGPTALAGVAYAKTFKLRIIAEQAWALNEPGLRAFIEADASETEDLLRGYTRELEAGIVRRWDISLDAKGDKTYPFTYENAEQLANDLRATEGLVKRTGNPGRTWDVNIRHREGPPPRWKTNWLEKLPCYWDTHGVNHPQGAPSPSPDDVRSVMLPRVIDGALRAAAVIDEYRAEHLTNYRTEIWQPTEGLFSVWSDMSDPDALSTLAAVAGEYELLSSDERRVTVEVLRTGLWREISVAGDCRTYYAGGTWILASDGHLDLNTRGAGELVYRLEGARDGGQGEADVPSTVCGIDSWQRL